MTSSATVKRAKGLELKQVLIADAMCEDGPGARAPTDPAERERWELRRSEFYVGMMRARDGLWVAVVRILVAGVLPGEQVGAVPVDVVGAGPGVAGWDERARSQERRVERPADRLVERRPQSRGQDH